LLHCRKLRVELLLRNGVVCIESFVPFEIDFRVRKKRLVALLLSLGLTDLNLERTRIDLCNQVAGSNHLPFADVEGLKLSIDA
jgi:hypothetical protein